MAPRSTLAAAREPLESISAETLADQAYRRLEEKIVTLAFEPGQVLTEAALAAELGIGRTPVREALQRLAFEGLIVVLPRRGVMVSEINLSHQLALLEVRREIERLIARKAAKRATGEECEAFATLARDLDEVAHDEDAVRFMRLDLAFNRMTIAACRNEYAAKSMRTMQGLSRRFWYHHYREVLDLPRCAKLHQAVAQAIAERNADAAAAASDALLDYIEEFARSTT